MALGWKRKGGAPRRETGEERGSLAQARYGGGAAQGDREWVKGHAATRPENEMADELARAGMAPFKMRPADRGTGRCG